TCVSRRKDMSNREPRLNCSSALNRNGQSLGPTRSFITENTGPLRFNRWQPVRCWLRPGVITCSANGQLEKELENLSPHKLGDSSNARVPVSGTSPKRAPQSF